MHENRGPSPLGSTDGFAHDSAERLRRLINTHIRDDDVARRLGDLAEAVEGSSAARRWSRIDLFEAFNVLMNVPHAGDEGGAHRIERLRNVLILAPIILTWAGISLAAGAYQTALAARPQLKAEPFLFLWQSGFDGHLHRTLTLSHLALADSVLILVVLGLTVLMQRRVQREEQAARGLVREFTLSLSDAALCLAEREDLQPADVAEVGREIQLVAGQMRELAGTMQGALRDGRALVADITRGVEQARSSNEVLATLVKSLDRSVGVESPLVNVAEGQRQLGAKITQLLSTVEASADRLTAAAAALLDESRLRTAEAAAQTRLAGTVAEVSAQLAGALHEARRGVLELIDLTVQLDQLRRLIPGYVDRLAGHLPSVLDDQERVSRSMLDASTHLQASARELTSVLDGLTSHLLGSRQRPHRRGNPTTAAPES